MVRFTVPIADILGNAYYRYEMTASNYNPTIDSTITISVIVKNVFGNPVENKSLTLYNNGSSVGSATTNSSGVATWSVTLSDWDWHHFSCNGATLELKANGWKVVHSGGTNPYYLAYNDNFVKAYINYSTSVNWSTTVGHLGAEWLKDGNIDLRPPMPVTVTPSPNKNIILSNTDYRVGWFTNSGTSTGGLYAHFLYARK